MNTKNRLQEEMKNALKEKNAERLSALRLLLAAITNKEIELGKKSEGLSDEEIIRVLQSEGKKRADSIEEFSKANREDRAQQERRELEVIKEFLPPEISDEELELIVKDAIQNIGTSSIKDFGVVMKAIMPRVAGRVFGDRVSAVVKLLLK